MEPTFFAFTTAQAMRSDLEALWSTWDRILDAVPAKRWTNKYGPDWTFEDVPYHVAYFDRVMVADPIEYSTYLPAEQRWEALTMRQLNDWNTTEFQKRPKTQTPQQSIAEMHAQRDRIRRLIKDFADADLSERQAFSHFFGLGFSTAGAALAGTRQHTFSEAWEFAQRLGRPDIRMPESIQHQGVAGYVSLLGSMVSPQAARSVGQFTMVMNMPGYAGGAWTIHVVNGGASVTEGKTANADLEMTMSTDIFMTMFKKLRNPMLLMLSGKIKVRGLSKMATFGKLFPEPPLDAPLRLDSTAAAAAA